MSKIKIITDSTADVRYEALEKYNIDVLPINIFFGDELKLDYFDIKADEFYSMLSLDNVPTTSQISPTIFYDSYKKAIADGFDTVIVFTLSKMASGTYNNAFLAAQMLKDDGDTLDIEIVDTMAFSLMYGRPVEIAAQMAESGCEKEEILNKVYAMLSRERALFAVDDISFLKKGGRIKPAVAAIANILDIKPLLVIEDGLVNSLDKVRGKKKLIPKMLEFAEKDGIRDATEIWIIHSDCEDRAIELKTAIEEKLGLTVNGISYIGPTVGVNVGHGTFSVIFFKN